MKWAVLFTAAALSGCAQEVYMSRDPAVLEAAADKLEVMALAAEEAFKKCAPTEDVTEISGGDPTKASGWRCRPIRR